MNLDKIVIVLSRPEESRNIGAVCRGMANNGIHTLRIVGDRNSIDVERVHILAIHAGYIFDRAEFFDSITEATKDCVCAAATTRRKGKKRGGKLFLPEEFASMADTVTGTKASEGGKVAVVFGNERTGLEDDEVNECTMGVTIPSSDEFGSLNLSHAVQIISYELFRKNDTKRTGYTSVSLERLDKTVGTISDSLRKIGFFSRTGSEAMEQFWRTVLSRASLTEGEAQYIEKTFDKAAGLAQSQCPKDERRLEIQL